jgi:hypothetical protein
MSDSFHLLGHAIVWDFPGVTRFSEKWVWNGVYSVSRVQLRSYLEEKVAAAV